MRLPGNHVVVATTWWGVRRCGNDVVRRSGRLGQVVTERQTGQEYPPRATSWVLFAVGMPVPMSRNCLIPASAAR